MNEIIVVTTAVMMTAAGIAAVVVNRFRKILAGVVALLAGVCPWLPIGAFFRHWQWLQGQWTTTAGMFGALPLFVIAFFLFGKGEVTPGRGFAAAASLAGMFTALGHMLFWFHLLSRMP